MSLNEQIKILKPCIKNIAFNKDEIEIETFYPLEFRKNFPNVLVNDESNREIFKDKYVVEIFKINIDFYETFMDAFEKAILESRDDIRKELILINQLKSLKGVGLNNVLAEKNIKLDESIVSEILSMDDFDYEHELYEVWDELTQSTSNLNVIQEPIYDNVPAPVNITPQTHSFDNMPLNADDGIMMVSMEEIENQYSEFDAGDDYEYIDE